MGEGWHNYHHTFPWDYKTAELGQYQYNFTAAFIDFMAAIGWAYDLKTVPNAVVLQRVQRTGDGSHDHAHEHKENAPWGWGDKDIPVEDAEVTETLHRLTEENLIHTD
jgi:stearoyl-CoA desaturase (delta-9 desaturase)